MGYDYYIKTEIAIVYQGLYGKNTNIIYTDLTLKGHHVFIIRDEDSDDDEDTMFTKLRAEIDRRIVENTYSEVIYEDGTWVDKKTKKLFEERIKREYPEVKNLIKIYKQTVGVKN